MTTTDTHGEGLAAKALDAAHKAYRDPNTTTPLATAIRAYLDVIGSDTAGPSDHAGLVRRLSENHSVIAPWLAGGEDGESRLEVSTISGLSFEGCTALLACLDAIPEAIAALSRAPEAEPAAWRYTEYYADRPAQTMILYDEPSPLPYPGRCKIEPLYATPPAPQPALALIEELTGALRIASASIQANCSNRHRIALAEIDTALASAKRFKTGE